MTLENSGNSEKEILRDRYLVQHTLSKKAGRRTLLARDLQTQELVVVKLLIFSSDFEWDDLKLFEREAETLKSISHPNIPQYLDYFEVDTPNYKGFALVQSYIPAQSLEQQLKAGRNFSEKETKQLAESILKILQYLHDRQPPVIHRDIKPSNILLVNRSGNSVGDVYLVDFGSVQTVDRTTGTMTVVGTYGYMPPEQFGGRANPASDLYSLGATLIYLVTGKHPADLPERDMRIEFESVANITPGFSEFLQAMTQPSLSKRLGSVRDTLSALEKSQHFTLTRNQETHISFGKPPNSKVTINKSVDSIEILIPPSGLLSYMALKRFILLIFCGLTVGSPLFFFALAMFDNAINNDFHPLTIFLFLLLSLFLIFIFIKFFNCLFGRKIIRIDGQQIRLIYELFGIEYPLQRLGYKKDIFRLDRTEDASVGHYLTIWAGTKKYEVFTDRTGERHVFAVTIPELDWITSELSKWLKLPINKY